MYKYLEAEFIKHLKNGMNVTAIPLGISTKNSLEIVDFLLVFFY